MMRLTLYSVDEANRVAAELRPELERLSRIKREFDQVEVRIEVLSIAVSGATNDNPDAVELQGLRERRAQLAHEISLGIEAVNRRGCVLKDLDQGLVDFYTLSGDRLIFLCWKLGEPEVAHWHALEGGFTTRQPLDRSERD